MEANSAPYRLCEVLCFSCRGAAYRFTDTLCHGCSRAAAGGESHEVKLSLLSHRKSALLAESLVTTLACCTLKPLALGHLQAFVLPMQMLEVATTAAELRRLLRQQGLAESKLLAFRDEHMEILLSKGLSTPGMLATAREATYTEPPPLPLALREALLDKFNPDALPAGTGRSCSTCCI